ncbi:MAG: hypothetical protein PF541_19140 [Prolixibacteraceae bacterium]|jgi:hypothetical protein|nr:hypothetical protein [Prolixibacteraceae bacterium]
MNKKIKKILFILIPVVIICIVIIAAYTFRKPATSVGNSKADLSITAIELFTNFENDEENANQIYLGKIIEVTGIVTEVIINQDKTTSIKLDSDNMFGAIICNFNTEEIKNIEEHESITIKGSCSGFLMDVILEKCTIVEV